VPTLAGSILAKVLQQLTAPRRGRLGAPDAQAGPQGDRLDWSQRQGQAFVELLEHLPTDRLHGKVAATVVVTLDQENLAAAVGVAGLDTGDQLSASETRRIACGAGILPAVLDGEAQPLDLGRSKRLLTEAQRTALATRHTTCGADGCERPFAWCELHHETPWSTDLSNALPLCDFHHQRIHDPAYEHRRSQGGAIIFHRRT
jgi:hypothetical protein